MYKTQQKTTRFHLKSVVLRVEVAGFEPAAFWSRTKRATKLRYTSILPVRNEVNQAMAGSFSCHKKRANRGTRTLDLLITSELLYHLSHIGTR